MAQLKVKQISDFLSAVGGIHDATVGEATVTAIEGVQSGVDANAEAIALNTLKSTNVTTNLAVTESTTTNIVTSSDGTDATLTAATTLKAGLMTKAMFDEHVANNAKKGITEAQSTAIVANKDAIATEKGRIDALLLDSTTALDTFAEIVNFIGELDTADIVGLSAALATAVSNDAVHTADISTNSEAIATLESTVGGIVTQVDLSLTATESTNTVVNSKGADAILNGATAELAGLMIAEDFSKLRGIEAGADVTDSVNVSAAGALMTGDIDNLDEVKAFASSDYATSAQGDLADTAVQDLDGLGITATADELNQLAGKTLGTAAYSATEDFATAEQGLLAESALQDASVFDVKGAAAAAQSAAEATAAADATAKADAAELAANGYTNTRETSILSTLRGEISAVAGVDKIEQIATFASITEFSVTRALSLDNNDILVFVNGLQIHQSGEGIDGFATANGQVFLVSGLGYNLEATDHIVVVGVAK